MAFDLTARLRVEDKASGGFRKATQSAKTYRDSMTRLQGENGRFTKGTEKSTSALDRMANASRRVAGGLNSVRSSGMSAFKGVIAGAATIAATVGGAHLAIKGLQSTIGEAAKLEMTTTTIEAMFKGDEKKAAEYFKFISQKAAESPLSESDFLGASKSAIIMTKNIDELKLLTNTAERLAVLDPVQGLEGAMLALRELNSGDIISLAERFEMPKKTLNAIKKLPLKKQLSALSTELDKYGITQSLITKQGETALGQYRKSVDKVKMSLRDMGVGALDKLKPKLAQFNKFLDSPKFAGWVTAGTKALTTLTTDVLRGIDKANAYIKDHFLNDPKWASASLGEKIGIVASDIGKKLGSALVSSLGSAVKTAIKEHPVLSALLGGLLLGKAVKSLGEVVISVKGLTGAGGLGSLGGCCCNGNGVDGKNKAGKAVKGAGKGAAVLSTVGKAGGITAGLTAFTAAMGYGASVWEKAGKDSKSIYSSSALTGRNDKKYTGPSMEEQMFGSLPPKYVPYVPKNIALNTQKAAAAANVNTTLQVNMGGVTVREEADVDKIANAIYRMVANADSAMGGRSSGGSRFSYDK